MLLNPARQLNALPRVDILALQTQSEVVSLVQSHIIQVHMVGLPPRSEPKWQRHFDVSRQISQRPYIPPKHRPPEDAARPKIQGGLDNVRVRIGTIGQ